MYEIPIIYNFDALSFEPSDGYGAIYSYCSCCKLYIGQTRQKMSERHWHHISMRSKECCVDKVLRNNEYELRIIYLCPKEQLNDAEMYFIKKYNTVFPNGWNFTKGGQSPISETSRQKWRASISRHYAENPVSDEFRQRMSEINKGRKHTPEHILKSSIATKAWHESHPGAFKGENNPMYGKHPSDKCIAILKSRRGVKSARSKCIYQYTLNGDFVKKWDSIADAAEYVSGKRDAAHISACANGKRKQAYGYIWKYS